MLVLVGNPQDRFSLICRFFAYAKTDADQLRSICAADQRLCFHNTDLSLVMRKTFIFAYVKTKTQTSCSVTAQLISAFVSATWMVQYLFFLSPKFQASSFLLCCSLVCVGPGRKPRGSSFFSTSLILSCRHHPRLTKLYY